MRATVLALTWALIVAASAAGQQPPGPGPDPRRNELDALLLQWENAMRSVQTISAECTRTSVDKTFQNTEVFTGTAKYLKPNLAMLEMQKQGNPQAFEKYIVTGTYVYEYAPQNKEIRVHEMPPPKPGQVADDSFLSFLFGIRAEEARRRYDLRLAKADEWYYYIEISPRFPADKQDFHRARLVLNKGTFLPRELWFEQANANEVRWDIPRIQSGVALNRQDFTEPAVPTGWRIVRVPRPNDLQRGELPPRVVRPSP